MLWLPNLKASVGRRNRVAHDAWMLYTGTAISEVTTREESAAIWVPWPEREATLLMQVRRGLAYLTRLLHDARTPSGSWERWH